MIDTLGLILLLVYLCCMVLFAQFKGDTSIVNFTWGGGVMLVALYTFFASSTFLARQIILTTMLILWALRLIVFLFMRYTGKDPRFVLWKWQGLKALVINVVWVFGQTIMIAVMSYPVFLVNTNNHIRGLTWIDFVGGLIWTVGFWYEAMGDYQLFVFMQNLSNKGRVMRFGLWRYCRHPNYFGESLMWWGVGCLALSLPYGWIALAAPVVITFLMVFVTGIPWIEKAMACNPEYQEYQKSTSKFIPWFPK